MKWEYAQFAVAAANADQASAMWTEKIGIHGWEMVTVLNLTTANGNPALVGFFKKPLED